MAVSALVFEMYLADQFNGCMLGVPGPGRSCFISLFVMFRCLSTCESQSPFPLLLPTFMQLVDCRWH